MGAASKQEEGPSEERSKDQRRSNQNRESLIAAMNSMMRSVKPLEGLWKHINSN